MICQRCGKEFVPKEKSQAHLKRHPPKFCSHECGKYARLSRVTLVCRQCGKEFQRKKYMEKWSQERGPFCSFACYGQWQKENTAGPANPNFVAESSRRGSGQWERNRKAVLERDHYACVRCGNTYRPHVHHREKWNPDDPKTHVPDNLETLCASCHRKAHPVPQAPDGKFVSIH